MKSRARQPEQADSPVAERVTVLLQARHSLAQTERIARLIGRDTFAFGRLMGHFLGQDEVLAQRAAWVLSKTACRYPELMDPWWKRSLSRVKAPCHNALKRNLLKVLETTGVPVRHESEILDLCMGWLADRSEPIAVHAYALTVVHRLCGKYPALLSEFRAHAGLLREQASPGIRSRLRKLGL